jgi:hypothetical protein
MQTANATAEEKRGPGNPAWRKNGESPNPAGRPKGLNKEKKTNKEIRSSELLMLTRRLKPHLSKAIMSAVDILDNKESAESSKLRASALIIQTYRELIKDVYDRFYDDEEGEEVQKQSAPILSFKMIEGSKEE